MILPALDNEIINEIKFGLPSKEIQMCASTVVIRHPRTDDFIVLKWRMPWHQTEALSESDFVELNDKRTFADDWSDLHGKHIIVNPEMLTLNAQRAIQKL